MSEQAMQEQAVTQEVTFDFNVTMTEANILLQGLGEIPAKQSHGLILKLQQQASSQLPVAQEVTE